MVVIALVIIGLFVFLLVVLTSPKNVDAPIACPADAKICPDGSAVGRIPPTCEFSPCPQDNTPTPNDTPVVPQQPVCPADAKICWDGSTVTRQLPDCLFADCPPEPPKPTCPSGEYSSSDCDSQCASNEECKAVENSECYVCASKIPNCYEWGMYPNEPECRSTCFYPNWCSLNQAIGTICWQCNEPYDYR